MSIEAMTAQEAVIVYGNMAISGIGIAFTGAQAIAQYAVSSKLIVIGFVAGLAISGIVQLILLLKSQQFDPVFSYGYTWVTSIVFGVIQPIEARLGWLKKIVDLTHPAFVGFSLGFTLGNLVGRVIDVIDSTWNLGWFQDNNKEVFRQSGANVGSP